MGRTLEGVWVWAEHPRIDVRLFPRAYSFGEAIGFRKTILRDHFVKTRLRQCDLSQHGWQSQKTQIGFNLHGRSPPAYAFRRLLRYDSAGHFWEDVLGDGGESKKCAMRIMLPMLLFLSHKKGLKIVLVFHKEATNAIDISDMRRRG